ncbi:OmpA/MotB family protein [Desulfocicer niacini]
MTKKKKEEDKGPVDLGPVMTVSLFLILLTFFIMLNSIAVVDERRVRASLGSILGAFGSFTGGYSASKTGESVTTPTAPMTESEIDFNQVLTLEDKSVAEQVSITPMADKEVITINSGFLFEPASMDIKPDCRFLLNRLCGAVRDGTYTIEIVGHTGASPAGKDALETNWEISARMAMAVYDYFRLNGKIDPGRLERFGAAGHRPVVSNSTQLSRAQNKRVEIILYTKIPEVIQRIFKKKPSNIFTFDTFDFRIFD